MTNFAYSTNEQDFKYGDEEEAAQAYCDDLLVSPGSYPFTFDVWSGECIEPTVDDLHDFNDVEEDMECRAHDFGGEYAEDWSVFGTKENKEKCRLAIREVVKSHMAKTNFYQIGKISKVKVTCVAEGLFSYEYS